MKATTKKVLIWGAVGIVGSRILSMVADSVALARLSPAQRAAYMQCQSGSRGLSGLSGGIMPAPGPYVPVYYNIGQRSVIHPTLQSGLNPTAL